MQYFGPSFFIEPQNRLQIQHATACFVELRRMYKPMIVDSSSK